MNNAEKLEYCKRLELYRQMFLIRTFENNLLNLFSKGYISGTTHTYSGQEAIAVSVIDNIDTNDIIFSNHRCHGHYLAATDDVEGLLNEIVGNSNGINQGYGGSQHIQRGKFYSNGIQGGYLPMATGMALAEKFKESNNIVVAFIGDGTWGQGIVYESLNIASLLCVPLLIVVENNGYAQTTPVSLNTAGKIIDRPKAFGISSDEITSSDIDVLQKLFKEKISIVRNYKKPYVQIVNTYRFNAHSKGDDTRDPIMIDLWKKNHDPILLAEEKLKIEDVLVIKKNVLDLIQYITETILPELKPK